MVWKLCFFMFFYVFSFVLEQNNQGEGAARARSSVNLPG